MGKRLTLLFPVSFDPVKSVDLIFQLPSRELSRDTSSIKMRILLNASKRFGSSRTHGIKLQSINQERLIFNFHSIGLALQIYIQQNSLFAAHNFM